MYKNWVRPGWNPKAYAWQIAIFTSIIGLSLVNSHMYAMAVSAWIGWTLRIAWEGTCLLPVQIGNIIISALIGSYALDLIRI